MTYSYLPAYGWARCPHCKLDFDATSAKPAFIERLPSSDTALYVLCATCHDEHESADEGTRKSISNRCFINVKKFGCDQLGRPFPWAITTALTLEINDRDLVSAIENGHNLSKDVYFGVLAGTHSLGRLPECQSGPEDDLLKQ